jgi:hypothetical protein
LRRDERRSGPEISVKPEELPRKFESNINTKQQE